MITNKVNTMPLGARTVTPTPRKRKAEVRYPALDRAIEDVKAGRVTTYSSAEEMFKKLGI